MQFSVHAVREVARLLQETGLQEITVENTDASGVPLRIRARRDVTATPKKPAKTAAKTTVQAAAPSATPSAPAEPQPVIVTASAVGVFRRSPLQAGEFVKRKQTVAVVESLKIPNEIAAPQDGRIVEFLIEDGHGVEYGQPLLVIMPETA
jgi:acetyl-CoA carboxylase biotin carboxyl carrier protein